MYESLRIFTNCKITYAAKDPVWRTVFVKRKTKKKKKRKKIDRNGFVEQLLRNVVDHCVVEPQTRSNDTAEECDRASLLNIARKANRNFIGMDLVDRRP